MKRPFLRLSSSSSSSDKSTKFEAPEPPSFDGSSVFPDIKLIKGEYNIPNHSENAIRRNNDDCSNYVVTGANRGIGFQIVKSLLENTKGNIIACCRDPSNAISLSNLPTNRIDIVQLDVENQVSITDLAETLKVNHDKRVDVLFNVAGILHDSANKGPERTLRAIHRDWAEKSMAVNYIGPLMLCQALAPMMKVNRANESQRAKTLIVNVSARVGSISDNRLGGWYSYRASKAALNQATRTIAHELGRQGTSAITFHPGTTDTDLSKPFQQNVRDGRLFPADFTVQQLLAVVNCIDEGHSGGFYDWSGKSLPF